ncbi:WD40 repeat domain-containing protein [Frigoriglobus tundricola]|uniref:Uncharacterized protein n=1 Tax=Frigoriglobus tundricola TaxID=2774151 RepID=A0A6M5YX63_9BACT|nr:WD40 repeat domain-containing protein [Frigoriglobus tundricola]QJW98579.1 hypothetical protein FTUN_6174 [Frigoriglobus tundricola]
MAAARLGCSVSTLKRRLDAGRDRLAARLARRGFAGPALLAALTAAQASGRVAPPAWVTSLGEDSLRGGVTELLQPGGPLALFGKTTAVVAVLAVGLAVAGGGPAQPPAEQMPTAPPLHETRVDRLGDPLPPGAVARLGSNRLHHGEEVERLAVSGDGRHVLSQGKSAWKLWEVETGKPLPGAGGKYAGKAILAAGPAGRGVAVVAWTDTGWVLADALTGATLLNMPGVGGHASGPAVRPDGKAVAYVQSRVDERTRSWWHGVKIWEAGKTEPTDLAGPVNRVFLTQLLYSPDSRRLAVQHGGDEGTQVWEPATGKLLLQVPNPENLVTQKYAFSPDGRRFYKDQRTKQKIRCWDLDTGTEQTPSTFAEGICYGLAVSPDGKTVVISTSSPQVFWVLDAATGKPIRQVRTRGGSVTDAAWAPDGKRFLTAERDDVIVRDAATAAVAFDPQGHWFMPGGVFWSPDGKQVTTWSNFPVLQVRRWDAATGQPVAVPPRSPAIPAEAADTGDGTRATFADKAGVVRAWDAVTGRELARVETKDAPVWHATLTRDRNLVAAGRTAVHVWDVDRAKMLATLPHTFKEALTVRVTAGGRRLVALGRESTAVVWELPSGKLVRRLELGGRWLDVSADGRFLLTDSHPGGRVELWDLDTGGRPRVLTTKGGDGADAKPVMFARFAPDGRSVAVGFRGPEVLVVETATGGRRFTFDSGVETTGYGAEFSPDGRCLATAAGRSTLVWDVSGEGRGRPPASAEAAWADLKEPDAVKGFAAVRYLAARKDEAVRLLSERVPPARRPDPEQVAAWVARLAADEFAEREAAERALAGVADAARRQLEAALAETVSPRSGGGWRPCWAAATPRSP